MKYMVSQLLLRKFLIIGQHLLSVLASRVKEVFCLHFLDFSLSFLNCSRSVSRAQLRDSSEKASLSVSVIKICSVWETSCCKSQIN